VRGRWCYWRDVVPVDARFSQGTDFTVRGELRSGSPRIYSEYFIELVDVMHRSPASRVDVPPDGTFEIRKVPSG